MSFVSMRFWFDANMSFRLSNMISALEEGKHTAIHVTQDSRFAAYNNEFGNSTPDLEFLRVLGEDEHDWTVISGDTSIIDTPHERAALISSGLTLFAFDDNFCNALGYEQPRKLIRMWPDIVRQAALERPGIYVVRTGSRPWIEKVQAGKNSRGRRF